MDYDGNAIVIKYLDESLSKLSPAHTVNLLNKGFCSFATFARVFIEMS